VIPLVCVLIPCGTYFPKGAEPANSQERQRGKGACHDEKFLEGDPEQARGRSPKPRRGASFHCRAAGRKRSKVPRLSARVRTQGEMKSRVSKSARKPRAPEHSVRYARKHLVSETGRRAKKWGL